MTPKETMISSLLEGSLDQIQARSVFEKIIYKQQTEPNFSDKAHEFRIMLPLAAFVLHKHILKNEDEFLYKLYMYIKSNPQDYVEVCSTSNDYEAELMAAICLHFIDTHKDLFL